MLPDQQFNQIPPEITMTPETARPPHFIFTLTILLIITAVFGVWYFFIQQPVDEPITEDYVKDDETENWQTYRNEEYGFEFRYPEGWTVNEVGDISSPLIYLESSGSTISIIPRGGLDRGLGSPILQENIVIDSKNALRSIYSGNLIIISVENWLDNNRIEISAASKQEMADQILSTFKFIPSTSSGQVSTSTDQGITAYNSGIVGQVTIGPTCPVMRDPPDPNCDDKPYQATLRIKNEADKVVIEQKTNADGTFKFNLPPGKYAIEDAKNSQIPFLKSVLVVVNTSGYTEANLSFDSGIR